MQENTLRISILLHDSISSYRRQLIVSGDVPNKDLLYSLLDPHL